MRRKVLARQVSNLDLEVRAKHENVESDRTVDAQLRAPPCIRLNLRIDSRVLLAWIFFGSGQRTVISDSFPTTIIHILQKLLNQVYIVLFLREGYLPTHCTYQQRA